MRLEGLARLIGAIVLAVATGLISYLVFDSIVGNQAASVMAADTVPHLLPWTLMEMSAAEPLG